VRSIVFINALREEQKGAAVLAQSTAVLAGDNGAAVRVVDPQLFAEVPGSPFSYGISEAVRSTFVRFSPYETDQRQVRQGLATADDFRFVRLSWEVSNARIVTGPLDVSPDTLRRQTQKGRTWVPFAKGGACSPYYSDLHLLVNWEDEGKAVKEHICSQYPYLNGKWEWVAKNTSYYFRPGITWPRRTSGAFSPRCLAAGSIFADKGPAAFAGEPGTWLAVLCSAAFGALVDVQIASGGVIARSYEVGVIQRTPVPPLSDDDALRLRDLAVACVRAMQTPDTVRETTHLFVAPLSTAHQGATIDSAVDRWNCDVQERRSTVVRSQGEIDVLCSHLYGLSDADIHADALTAPADMSSVDSPSPDTDTADDEAQADDLRSTTVSLLSYAVGCCFGRWNIRYATGEKTPPELPDPFAPLPVCSPGMLQGEDGLPLTGTPSEYPLHINWNGILVDEPNHSDDILKRVRESLHVLWPKTSESIEAEMCDALGVKDLRDYFHKPGNGGFWMNHVHMYSKSHRKAPIYWLLQSSHKNYGIWLYYQHLDSDLLFKVLQNYVEPKLKLEQNHEAEASHKLTTGGLSVSETRQAQKDLEHQQDLVAEIRDFRDTLKKAADLRLTPNLDDGVVLNIAPLHDLVPWAEASKYWDELLAGKYPWSSIGKQLEQKGMV